MVAGISRKSFSRTTGYAHTLPLLLCTFSHPAVPATASSSLSLPVRLSDRLATALLSFPATPVSLVLRYDNTLSMIAICCRTCPSAK